MYRVSYQFLFIVSVKKQCEWESRRWLGTNMGEENMLERCIDAAMMSCWLSAIPDWTKMLSVGVLLGIGYTHMMWYWHVGALLSAMADIKKRQDGGGCPNFLVGCICISFNISWPRQSLKTGESLYHMWLITMGWEGWMVEPVGDHIYGLAIVWVSNAQVMMCTRQPTLYSQRIVINLEYEVSWSSSFFFCFVSFLHLRMIWWYMEMLPGSQLRAFGVK